ncbi:V-type ATPase subunit [Candidatus Bathyarchaeota archaeon]|nr:V-type ATPase subunit [Candidatus Bathyarchaeota archaeon]
MSFSPSGYEYVNAMVRGQVGKLLEIQDYEAMLGCSRPRDIKKVLRKTPYSEPASAQPDDFSSIMSALTYTVGKEVGSIIGASPESVKPLLEGYILLLESRNIVNSIRVEVGDNPTFAEAGIIPLTTLKDSDLKSQLEALVEWDVKKVIQELKGQVAIYNCTAPLLTLIHHCGKMLLNKILEIPAKEKTSMVKLVESIICSVDIEILLKGTLYGVNFSEIQSWLSNHNKLECMEPTYCKDIESLLVMLRSKRHGICLPTRPDNQFETILERFPYCTLANDARSTMSGYPFRTSTVAAGISLKFVEGRNLRLAVMGASGKIDRRVALKLMVIPR